MLNSVVIWQKSTQHCKSNFLQLKNKLKISTTLYPAEPSLKNTNKIKVFSYKQNLPKSNPVYRNFRKVEIYSKRIARINEQRNFYIYAVEFTIMDLSIYLSIDIYIYLMSNC